MNNRDAIFDAWIMIEHLLEGGLDENTIEYNSDYSGDYYSFFKDNIDKHNKVNTENEEPSIVESSGFFIFLDVFKFKELIAKLRENEKIKSEPVDEPISEYRYSLALGFNSNFDFLKSTTFVTTCGFYWRNNRFPENSELKEQEEELSDNYSYLFENCYIDDESRIGKRIIDPVRFNKAIEDILRKFNTKIENCRFSFVINIESQSGKLHSFFIEDLYSAKQSSNALIDNYLFGREVEHRINLDSDNRSSNFSENQLRAILNPKNYPLGKFPSETRFHLYLMQQVAVNLSTGYDDSRIRSVNGPPGTGKTTLLKDIFAELIVKQAYEICKLGNDKFVKGNRETIYDHDENGKTKFIGNLSNEIAKYNIVVASSNNSAVQNIVDEIPLVSKIDKNLVNELKAADYFYKLANLDVKVNWEKVIETSWKWINMTIPIISTTFASFWSMFKRLRPDSMGHLFIDEAGQAIPQAAVGAVLRSKYVMAVGDPAQITPVNTLGPKIMNWIGELKAVTEKYVSASASVQSLIDATSKYGYYRDDSDWVGIPLWVHRRCKSPMFDISNKVSYNNLMVQAEPQNGIFGWYDIKGVATDKYVEEQGNKLYELLSEKIKENPKIIDKEEKDVIYVISPFKNVAKNLIEKLEDLEFVRKKDHKVTNIGTIHTFQGKEAPIVYLVLGADEKSIGAARWAVSEPNMINVAASRAKEEFYIIGDIDLYKNLNSCVMNDTLSVIMKYYSDHKDKAILFPVDNAKKDFVIPEYSKSDYNTISGQDTDQNSYRDYSERILLFRTWLEDRGFKVSRQDSNYIISDSNNTAILDDYELLALCKKEEHVDIRVKFAEWLKAHGFFKQTYFPVVCHVAGHLSRDCAVTTDVGEIYPICGSNNGRHLVALNEKGNPDDFMLFDSVWDDPFDTVYYPVDGVAGENDGYQALFCDPRNFIKHSDCDIGKQTFEDAIIFKPGEEKNARLICPMFVSAAGDHYIAIDIDVSEEILKVEPVGEDTYMDIHGNYYKLFSSYLGI